MISRGWTIFVRRLRYYSSGYYKFERNYKFFFIFFLLLYLLLQLFRNDHPSLGFLLILSFIYSFFYIRSLHIILYYILPIFFSRLFIFHSPLLYISFTNLIACLSLPSLNDFIYNDLQFNSIQLIYYWINQYT